MMATPPPPPPPPPPPSVRYYIVLIHMPSRGVIVDQLSLSPSLSLSLVIRSLNVLRAIKRIQGGHLNGTFVSTFASTPFVNLSFNHISSNFLLFFSPASRLVPHHITHSNHPFQSNAPPRHPSKEGKHRILAPAHSSAKRHGPVSRRPEPLKPPKSPRPANPATPPRPANSANRQRTPNLHHRPHHHDHSGSSPTAIIPLRQWRRRSRHLQRQARQEQR